MIPTLSFILLLATAVPPTAPAPPRSLIDLSGASTVTLSDEARGLYARGHAQLRDGDSEGAVESFSQLIEQRPDFVEAYLSRAHAYRRLEQQATAVEDQDRYALAYISDEKQVTRNSSRSFIRKEMDEVLTKRVLALTAIYFVCWGIVCYFWWHLEQSLEFATILVVIANAVAWSIPATPGRLSFGVGALFFLLFVAATKQRGNKSRPLDDDSGSRPTNFETEMKVCPECSREVSQIARVCPRCSHRF